MKRAPTNLNLIRTLKLNKEENQNDKSIQTNISIPINNYRNKMINTYIRNIILEKERRKFLNRKNLPFSDRNVITKKFKQESDIYNIYKYNIQNLKEKLSKPVNIKKILIANSLNKKKSNKRPLFRNNNNFIAFDSTSFYKPFSDITPKSNKSTIILNQISNICSREKIKKKFQDSKNEIESKIFSTPLNKQMKSKKKEIFFWKLNNKSTRNKKENETNNLNNNEYVKKWDIPKSLSFDKLTGREGKINNPIKFHYLERLHNYTPIYDLVSCNDNKSYIKYNPNLNIEFNQYKKNMTRKFICDHLNLMNNPGNNYNILNYLNKRKFENLKKILGKKKQNRTEEKFVYFNKKSNNY